MITNSGRQSGQPIELKSGGTTLYGHSGAIKSIAISKSFSIAVTGDANGVCIVWDLNRLSYVRTLCKLDTEVDSLVVSETLGDIVAVNHHFDQHNKSSFSVHTINGEPVGRVDTDSRITAICYSTAAEGLSVNVIATAFVDGSISLWSSWDLTAVGSGLRSGIELPITWFVTHPNKYQSLTILLGISLTFSNDNQLLYVAYSDHTVVVWENGSNRKASRTVSLSLV